MKGKKKYSRLIYWLSIFSCHLLFIAISLTPSYTQNTLEDELAALEKSLDELDTAGLLFLLDSLVKINDRMAKTSHLALKVGYNSQVLNAGRDFDLDQFGLSYGVAFHHYSGVYADLTGYSNSQNEPNYYLNLATIGYIGELGKNWSYLASYDHYFYRKQTSDIAPPIYTDGLNISLYSSNQRFESGLHYSLVFGDTLTAHRITWSVQYNLDIQKAWFFDKITLTPVLGMTFGNGTSFLLPYSRENLRRFRAGRIAYEEVNTFGLLNYTLSIPVSFHLKNFNLMAAYQYNIPSELPGQNETLDNSGFISLNASYFISF